MPSLRDTITVNVTEPIPNVEIIERGVFDLPGLSGVEAATPLFNADTSSGPVGGFGLQRRGYPISFSGNEGFITLDLSVRAVLFQRTDIAPQTGALFGTVGLSSIVATDTSDAYYGHGASGNGFFTRDGASQFNSGTTYDAYPAGGTPYSGWATSVGPSLGVQFIAPEPRSFGRSGGVGFGFTSTVLEPNLFEGELVSAYLPEGGSEFPALVLTRGVASFLYEVEGPTPNASPLGLGLDARRIRCTALSNGGQLCGVSVFGDDRLAVVNWTVISAPTLGGFAAAGDGPVGIDLHPLPSGTYALASANFNDNTITEAEVSATGSVLSSETRAAASACTNPGHVTYIRDAESLKLVYTCFNSGNFVVEDSRF